MFASGEMPDAGVFPKNNQYMYYDEELSRLIPMSMIREYCPSIVQVYDENPVYWAYTLYNEDNTLAYGLPCVSETYPQLYLWTDFYRYDWITALNLDLGVEVEKISDNFYVTKGGVPIDNFTVILEGFASKGDDIIPATWNGDIPAELLSPFGLVRGIVNNNGEADQYYVLNAYRDCLEYLAGLYEKGLIDPEFPTQDRNVWWDKVNTQKVGYFTQSSNALNSWAVGRPPLTLWGVDSKIPILMTPGVADKDGNYVSNDYVPMPTDNNSFFVNANVKDDGKLAKILQLCEYSRFPGDLETLATFVYGEKGVEWEWSKDRDNWPVAIGVADPTKNRTGSGIFLGSMEVGDYWQWLTLEPLFASVGKYCVKSMGGIWNEHKQYPYTEDLFSETDLKNLATELDNVNTVQVEFRNAVIMGKTKITDETWSQYLDDLNTAGYQKLRTEYNKAPKVSDILAKYSK